MKALDWLSDHMDVVVNVVVAIFGTSAIIHFASDFAVMLAAYPLQSALLALMCLFLGFDLNLYGRLAEKAIGSRDRVKWYECCFLTMSPRRKAIVWLALKDGAVHLSCADTDALALCDMQVLGTPPIGGKTTGVDYSVKPSVVKLLISHRGEWMPGITDAEARKLVSGIESGGLSG